MLLSPFDIQISFVVAKWGGQWRHKNLKPIITFGLLLNLNQCYKMPKSIVWCCAYLQITRWNCFTVWSVKACVTYKCILTLIKGRGSNALDIALVKTWSNSRRKRKRGFALLLPGPSSRFLENENKKKNKFWHFGARFFTENFIVLALRNDYVLISFLC